FLDEHLDMFGESKKQLLEQKQKSKEDMDEFLEEIKVVRDNVKERVGESLQAISKAAEKIAADVVAEMTGLHSQVGHCGPPTHIRKLTVPAPHLLQCPWQGFQVYVRGPR